MAKVDTRVADDNHVVHSLETQGGDYCKTPCRECPWRKENVGTFPAEAFRLAAHTAYDASLTMFACHRTGAERPHTCAGFLLSETAEDNCGVRILVIREGAALGVEKGEADLFDTYQQMAVANGVGADEEVLARCMPEWRK